MALEIERKFLIPAFPESYRNAVQQEIEQGYLVIAETGDEARIRRKGKQYSLTIKSGAGLQRQEFECALTKDQFEALWPASAGKRLQKTRYLLPDGIELDVYQGALSSLIVAEVEFESLEKAQQFEIPDWFGPEITELAHFKNQSLSGLKNLDQLFPES